jgi:drug/metabolite transporter (DMT)-like permease
VLPSGANRRGVVAIVGAMAVFAVSDVLTKLIARTHPLGEVLTVRGLFTIVLMGGVIAAFGHARYLRLALGWTVLVRSALDAASSTLYVAALVHMRLAELSAVVLLSPVILTFLAVVLYREVVGWRRWVAVWTGFVGVLFIVKPTPTAFDGWAVVALAAAFVSASRDVITRRVDPGIPTTVVAFMSVIALTLVGLGLGVGESWQAMAASDYGVLTGAAVFFSLAIYFMALAFRGAAIAVVAPFRYSHLLWAGLAGYAAFGELPDAWSAAGAMLIVASGLYVLHRDAERRRLEVGQTGQSR